MRMTQMESIVVKDFFFFQAEDGIRDDLVTGVQTCALPIYNVRSAMEAAARNSFDLLISDIALPDGTGTELMTYLHAISRIPGIAISGFGMNGDIEKSIDAGFAEHLVKPVKMENLEAAIDRVMATATL